MAILQQLGINDTFFFQLIIFAIAYFTLAASFAGYTKAKAERDHQTKGGESLAVEIAEQTSSLKAEYENKARAVSSQIKSIFDEQRSQALREYDAIVSKAKKEAQELVEMNRVRIESELGSARSQLTDQIPQVAAAITNKLLAK